MNEDIKRFFPEIESGIKPLGGGVLIQGKYVPSKTAGGIQLISSTQECASYDVNIGKVIAMGDLAYKNKETLEPWKEGQWCKIGDIVSIPRTGSRYTKEIDGEIYHFVLVQDTEVKTVFEDLTGFNLQGIL